MQDILSRARRVWKLVDGKPTPMENDTTMFGKDGKSVLSFEEWAQDLAERASFLFEESGGGGSNGSGGEKNKAGGGKTDKEALAKMNPQARLEYLHGSGAKK
jgi:hypothetical protein